MRPRTGFTYLCTLARPIDHPRVWNIPKEITDGEDHACQYCRNCNSLLEEPRPEGTFCSGGLTLPSPSNRARLPSIICCNKNRFNHVFKQDVPDVHKLCNKRVPVGLPPYR